MAYSDPESELEEFVETLRNMALRDADNEEVVSYVISALKGEVDAGIINSLVDECAYKNMEEIINYRVEEIKLHAEVAAEAEKEAEYQEYMKELQSKYESMVMYDLVEEKFMSEPDFRAQVLGRLRKDLLDSKSSGEFSKLYQMTLEHTDTQEIVSFLMSEFSDDLFTYFKQDLIGELAEKYENQIAQEIRETLYKDQAFINRIKTDFIREVASKILD